METQTGPRRADIALRVSFTTHLLLEVRTCLTLPLVLGCLWSFYHSDGILLNIHMEREGGRIKTKQESDHLSRNDPFVLPISEIDIIMEKLS